MEPMIDFQLIYNSLPYLLRGTIVSLEIAFLGCLIGVSLGTVLGLLQSGTNKLTQWFVAIYATIFRGTPMLIQITFVYSVLPEFGIVLPAFWSAVIAIGLNSAAYLSQIIRSGISSVGKGQIEAAHVMGFSKLQTIRYIVLPQAFAVIVPALGNEFITLVKDSSLASTIGVAELYKEATRIKGISYDVVSVYTAVSLIYLVITTTLSIGINKLEKRMNRHVRN